MAINLRNNVPKEINSRIGSGIYTPQELIGNNLKWKFMSLSVDNEIAAYCELVISQKYIEIYNVFTVPKYRRRGYASKLLDAVKKNYLGYNLWLGIKPETSNVRQELQTKGALYAKLGFTSDIKITNKTHSGKILPFNFIQMVYKSFKVPKVNKVLSKVNMLTKSALKSHNQISILVTIPKSYLMSVRNFLMDKHPGETAGVIQVQYLGFRDGMYKFRGQDTIDQIRSGTNTVQFLPININTKRVITWHTHPKVCYTHYGACIGLPSPLDFRAFIQNFLEGREICSIVFALEAIYVVYIRRHVRRLIWSMNNKAHVLNNIYTQIDNLRTLHDQEMQNLSYKQKNSLINEFEKAVHNIVITQNGKDYPIFKMKTYKTFKDVKNYTPTPRFASASVRQKFARASAIASVRMPDAYKHDLIIKVPYDIEPLQNLKKRNTVTNMNLN